MARANQCSADDVDWEAVARAAQNGARSVRGLDEEDYADAKQEGAAAPVKHRERNGSLPNDPSAYAEKSAKNAALRIGRRRQRETVAPHQGNAGDATEQDTGIADGSVNAFASGRRERTKTKLSKDECIGLACVRDMMVRELLPLLEESQRFWQDEAFERSVYRRIGTTIEGALKQKPPDHFIDEMVAFRKRYLGREPLKRRDTVDALPKRPGRQHRGFEQREADFHTKIGGIRIPPEAQYLRRKRRELTKGLVSHALELCGYSPEDLNAVKRQEAMRREEQKRKLCKKVGLPSPATKRRQKARQKTRQSFACQTGRDPAFSLRRPKRSS